MKNLQKSFYQHILLYSKYTHRKEHIKDFLAVKHQRAMEKSLE